MKPILDEPFTRKTSQHSPSPLLLDNLPPAKNSVVLFIRHAERPEIPHQETGNDLKLTEEGQRQSRALGLQLGQNIKSISSSPIARCMETASNIKQSSESTAEIIPSKVLGDPGAYVYDETLAWNNWLEKGSESVLSALMDSKQNPPGLHSVKHGTAELLEYFKPLLAGENGYHICVSHDVMLLPFIAHLFSVDINKVPWPGFLQAVSLEADNKGFIIGYQTITKHIMATSRLVNT